jgi:hypothetical protein
MIVLFFTQIHNKILLYIKGSKRNTTLETYIWICSNMPWIVQICQSHISVLMIGRGALMDAGLFSQIREPEALWAV